MTMAGGPGLGDEFPIARMLCIEESVSGQATCCVSKLIKNPLRCPRGTLGRLAMLNLFRDAGRGLVGVGCVCRRLYTRFTNALFER